MKLSPDEPEEAVKVAQVPLVYQVPREMMQPFWLPFVITLRCPRPLKGVPGLEVDVGDGPEPVVVLKYSVSSFDLTWKVLHAYLVGVLPPLLFGRYLIPDSGHVESVNESAGSKVPV